MVVYNICCIAAALLQVKQQELLKERKKIELFGLFRD